MKKKEKEIVFERNILKTRRPFARSRYKFCHLMVKRPNSLRRTDGMSLRTVIATRPVKFAMRSRGSGVLLGDTAEAEVGGRTVRGVLASGCAPVSVAVRL